MDKIKIGIPRSIPYYYYGNLWMKFFQILGCETIVSPQTNRELMENGIRIANDEMCLSMKNFFGHVLFLEGKCDYILIPRIDNYGLQNQTCTNFLALFDLIQNTFSTPILNYNVDVSHHDTEVKGFLKIGEQLGFSVSDSLHAYLSAKQIEMETRKQKVKENLQKANTNKVKILIIGHPYNIYDAYIGKPILSFLEKLGVELIYSDLFPKEKTNKMANQLSKELYWKYNKEMIGAIPLVKNKIDGVLFLSTFPCGPDSLVNELVMRKIKLPYLNLIIDDMDGLAGFETRLESFIDIVEERKKKYA